MCYCIRSNGLAGKEKPNVIILDAAAVGRDEAYPVDSASPIGSGDGGGMLFDDFAIARGLVVKSEASNCSRSRARVGQATLWIGKPWRVRRIASCARIEAVSSGIQHRVGEKTVGLEGAILETSCLAKRGN